MLTYSHNKNTFMCQIRPFIDMYIRRTILNGSNPNKNSLNRGDTFHFLSKKGRLLLFFNLPRGICVNRITQIMVLKGPLGMRHFQCCQF